MTDLTKLTAAYGLLDAETQEALKAHGGPYELWRGGHWGDKGEGEEFDTWYTYRVKPQPPKPREKWVFASWAYDDKDMARAAVRGGIRGPITDAEVDAMITLYREVLE